MKRYLASLFTIFTIVSLVGLGCGEDNYKTPYDASDGASIGDIDDITIESGGGAGVITYWFDVRDGGKPLNDIDVALFIFPNHTISSYAPSFDVVDVVDKSKVEYWDDDGNPHFTTGDHGELTVDVRVPAGFAGVMGVVFDIGVDQSESEITVNPAGNACFDGDDNDSDGGIDFGDIDCADQYDADES